MWTRRAGRLASGLLLLTISACGRTPSPVAPADAPRTTVMPQPVMAEHLPNPWRIHPQVISGGLPAGDAAFEELAELGIRTIISVDGAPPDVDRARRYGLRYVHLPHGYDGVPERRAQELAKAVRDLPGPIYIHCHHGKHRSPAAATVACVGAGLMSSDRALGVLKAAGTGENYRGLYQSALTARRFDDALLDALPADFPESVRVPPIADAMIAIEHTNDRLKKLAARQWRPEAEQPDVTAAHEALLLREHYTELLRTADVARQPAEFRTLLLASEERAEKLATLLTAWSKAGESQPPPAEIGQAWSAVSQDCSPCHRQYRDVPLSEKPAR